MPGDEVIFRNGAVFDGRAFLPDGTCVRVADGTITAVGPVSEVAGPGGLAGVNVVDLEGGTLLPGFTDAHVHPVYAGDQLRRCELREGGTAQDYLDIIAAYGDYADPAALLPTVVLPDGSQNYDNFTDPKITSALEQARGTADPNKRAALVAQAEKLTIQQMPWIPNTQPTSLLLLNKSLTGAVSSFAYMFAPWANQLGETG